MQSFKKNTSPLFYAPNIITKRSHRFKYLWQTSFRISNMYVDLHIKKLKNSIISVLELLHFQ